jgi:hypothetical protein
LILGFLRKHGICIGNQESENQRNLRGSFNVGASMDRAP